MIKVIGVRFRTAGKIYFFDPLDFEVEILEYRVHETRNGDRKLTAEGKLAYDAENNVRTQSRFTALNEMGICLSQKDEEPLKEKMKKYLTDSAMMEELFPLM